LAVRGREAVEVADLALRVDGRGERHAVGLAVMSVAGAWPATVEVSAWNVTVRCARTNSPDSPPAIGDSVSSPVASGESVAPSSRSPALARCRRAATDQNPARRGRMRTHIAMAKDNLMMGAIASSVPLLKTAKSENERKIVVFWDPVPFVRVREMKL